MENNDTKATCKEMELAILFADIAGSARLYEVLGDEPARNLLSKSIQSMADVTAAHGGTVIKTIGDEIMCTFPTADAAVAAAKEMHQSIATRSPEENADYPPPNIYVGIQWGTVINEGNDVFGDAVNIAARMVSMSKQRQIITTKDTLDMLSKKFKKSARLVDKTTIKGKSGEMLIYEILWEVGVATVKIGVEDPIDEEHLVHSMGIKFAGQIYRVDSQQPDIAMGRLSHNDIVVKDNRVSRSHARIQYRRGKFFLVDSSTNGTYVQITGKGSRLIRREEVHLVGSGFIGLGREINTESPIMIDFRINVTTPPRSG